MSDPRHPSQVADLGMFETLLQRNGTGPMGGHSPSLVVISLTASIRRAVPALMAPSLAA